MFNGIDNSIAITWDNFKVHDNEQSLRVLKRGGVYGYNLIPNATHFQQPIDQNIGIFFQNYCKRE